MVILFWAAVILLLESWVGLTFLLKDLEDVPEAQDPEDLISVIVAARNEEKKIEEAVVSFLNLDYPRKEIIVVDDRSTDRTGEILDALRARHPELRVVHIKDLPDGWLGKNHAHYVGARESHGDWVLFTDGDVIMEKSILRRAHQAARDEGADHLTVAPYVPYKTIWPRLAHAGFMLFFNLAMRPWLVRYRRTPAFSGLGAFNMFKRNAYEIIGTHRRIALRPDDDMRLGQLIKKRGLASRVYFGFTLLKVEWYETLREMVSGLMKNSFAGMNYSFFLLLLATLGFVAFFFAPPIGALFLDGRAQVFGIATVGLHVLMAGVAARRARYSFWNGLGIYFSVGVMLFILWKASLRTLCRGGIEWRGTFYSLKELRKNKI